MDILNNFNEIGNKLNNINLKIDQMQENFLQSKIGQVINSALDFGIKELMPDFMENEIIEVKDTIISEGFKEGVSKAIDSAIEIGKNAIGLFSNEFSSIEQAKEALKEGGIIDGISNGLDYVLEKLEKNDIISDNLVHIIKNGKNLLLNNFESDINQEFSKEINSLNKIEKYIKKWEKGYSNKDIDEVNKQYEKIQKEMKKILPLENIINNVKKIENINNLINNSKNFNFDSVYLDLAQKI